MKINDCNDHLDAIIETITIDEIDINDLTEEIILRRKQLMIAIDEYQLLQEYQLEYI